MREEKRSEIIHDALNFLDDEMIEEVEKLRGGVREEKKEPKQLGAKKWVAIAAGICLLVLIGGIGNKEFAILQSGEANDFSKPESGGVDIGCEDVIDSIIDSDDGKYMENDMLESMEEETTETKDFTEIEETTEIGE